MPVPSAIYLKTVKRAFCGEGSGETMRLSITRFSQDGWSLSKLRIRSRI